MGSAAMCGPQLQARGSSRVSLWPTMTRWKLRSGCCVWLGALVLFVGCMRNTRVKPGEQPAEGEVIVVGRATMNPVLKPPNDAPSDDPFDTGTYSRLGLFFFARPDDPIDREDLLSA